ncbi:MAG: TIGR00730 family Rossman fold protein [Flavobacteriaceae bacterium]|nr:TIGR00730 family Rossman fold protein [Flavobacteriaceae bacterium]
MKRITVFCGSSLGTEKIFELKARELGKRLALENIELVYGGASIGLMGAVADGALSVGGNVIGVLPKFLRLKEITHEKLTQLILVDTMHERKTIMDDLCDGVISLPGGFGTLEEFFEMLTWGQLGLHKKPIGILNVNGFYDELISLMDTMVKKGFLKDSNRQMVLVSDSIDHLLEKMKTYQAPSVGKWITKETI